MKLTTLIRVSIPLLLLLTTIPAASQSRKATLQWLRQHLDTLVQQSSDPDFKFTRKKIYTFDDDALLVATYREFEDPELNGAPAFGKIWYKDIIPGIDSTAWRSDELGANIYTLMASKVYTIIGRPDAPLQYWTSFDEPSGLDIYLPGNKVLADEIIRKILSLGSAQSENQHKSDKQFSNKRGGH